MFIKKYKIKIRFCEENGKNISKMKGYFQEIVKFRSWKTWKSNGKGPGK